MKKIIIFIILFTFILSINVFADISTDMQELAIIQFSDKPWLLYTDSLGDYHVASVPDNTYVLLAKSDILVKYHDNTLANVDVYNYDSNDNSFYRDTSFTGSILHNEVNYIT